MISAKGEFTVWMSKVENKGKYGVLTASTSKKDKANDGKWIYSNWYIRLVGEAHEKMVKLVELYVDGEMNDSGFLTKKIPVVITSFSITNEPYEKDGTKVWNNIQLVAWDWKLGNTSNKKKESSSPFDEDEE